jgi:hypothetical protein
MMNFLLTLGLLAALVWIVWTNDRQFQGWPLAIIVVLGVAALVVRPRKRED